MKEKEIKKYLNQTLDSMAPDLLENICSQKMDKIETEEELFGTKEPLFGDDKKKKILWGSLATAVLACLLAVVILMKPAQPVENQYAYSIVIDVNPSITVEFDEKGELSDIIAGNKDAKKIVQRLKKQMKKNSKSDHLMGMVIEQLTKEGYLKKKKASMLVTVISDSSSKRKEVLNTIQYDTKRYEVENEKKLKTVFQDIKMNKKVQQVAKEKKISVGKAALCIKLAEAGKADYDTLCEKSIYNLVNEIEKTGIAEMEEDLYLNDEPIVMEGEIDFSEESSAQIQETSETESVSEEITTQEVLSQKFEEQTTDDKTTSEITTQEEETTTTLQEEK